MNNLCDTSTNTNTMLTNTSVQGVRGEDEHKVLRHLDAVQKILIKLSSSQSINVEEDGESSQLKMNFQQTDRWTIEMTKRINKYDDYS